MKVQELRELLRRADRGLLEKAFAESYKHFTKRQKEEMDLLIQDILEGKSANISSRKASVDFEELEQQITEFIANAYARNYFEPNRVIPKNQRPKWRFRVKGYIKELEKIQPESEYYARMVKLLTDLYRLLCEACNYYYFSTDDPFRSIGWEQEDLFLLLAKKTLGAGYSGEAVRELILTASTGGLSRESLHIYHQMALLSELKTSDVKYMAIEEAEKLVEERKAGLAGLKEDSNKKYYLEEDMNNFCDMVLLVSIALAETEKGLRFYFKNCSEANKEIILYRALSLVELLDDDGMWIQVYEYGLRKKIKPRDYLKKRYEEIAGQDMDQAKL